MLQHSRYLLTLTSLKWAWLRGWVFLFYWMLLKETIEMNPWVSCFIAWILLKVKNLMWSLRMANVYLKRLFFDRAILNHGDGAKKKIFKLSCLLCFAWSKTNYSLFYLVYRSHCLPSFVSATSKAKATSDTLTSFILHRPKTDKNQVSSAFLDA